MGVFSWKTQDTDRSICCTWSGRDMFPVTMTDNNGNKWTEKGYEGYGVFAGKDFYELLAEMNGKKDREDGIALWYGDNPFLSPNLNESENVEWVNRPPDDCEFQGYFYEDGEDSE